MEDFFKKIPEFFEGDDSRLSMTRLLCFLSFFPASYVLCTCPSEGMLGIYLTAYSGAYVGGKFADASMAKRKSRNFQDKNDDQ